LNTWWSLVAVARLWVAAALVVFVQDTYPLLQELHTQ
jgi:hypothetical protein